MGRNREKEVLQKAHIYKLDAEPRDLESQGPWAVAFRVIARMLLQGTRLSKSCISQRRGV